MHDNYIEVVTNGATPPGAQYGYGGADGIQVGSGSSIFNNTFMTKRTNVYTSAEHPDTLQFNHSVRVKVYNNDFINVGDAAIGIGTWVTNAVIEDIWIYNNLFRIIEKIDPYPDYIRLYSNPGNILTIKNLKIMNNLFLDNPDWWPVSFYTYGGATTASGVEIKNNIFYNAGRGKSFAAVRIDDSGGFTAASFSLDGNVYYSPVAEPYVKVGNLGPMPANEWVAKYEPNGSVSKPSFVNYTPFSASNDLRLHSQDNVAKDAGVNLTHYFGTDKNGVTRPQVEAWDIGPYQSSK